MQRNPHPIITPHPAHPKTNTCNPIHQWRRNWGGKGGQSATPDSKNLPDPFTLPLLTGLATLLPSTLTHTAQQTKNMNKPSSKNKHRIISLFLWRKYVLLHIHVPKIKEKKKKRRKRKEKKKRKKKKRKEIRKEKKRKEKEKMEKKENL